MQELAQKSSLDFSTQPDKIRPVVAVNVRHAYLSEQTAAPLWTWRPQDTVGEIQKIYAKLKAAAKLNILLSDYQNCSCLGVQPQTPVQWGFVPNFYNNPGSHCGFGAQTHNPPLLPSKLQTLHWGLWLWLEGWLVDYSGPPSTLWPY